MKVVLYTQSFIKLEIRWAMKKMKLLKNFLNLVCKNIKKDQKKNDRKWIYL